MAGELGCRRRGGGEERFYCPPAMRERYNQQQQQQQPQPQRYPQNQKQQQQQVLNTNNTKVDGSDNSSNKGKSKGSSRESSEKRIDSDDAASSATTASYSSSPVLKNVTNLDRFLEHTTPAVIAQKFAKASMKQWKTRSVDLSPYFILGDLWESFREWSAYGAGVPLVLNGSDSVIQYYVPYLSGIQLYMDPSKAPSGRRRLDASDADSSRETSSNGSSEGIPYGQNSSILGTQRIENSRGAAIRGFNMLPLTNNHPVGLSTENEIRNPPGLLLFEYMEYEPPYSREPLADKISALTSQYPEIKLLRSCDLTTSSWMSVAWYPIYRIPTGPTLQNLDACFLTYHSLSTPLRSTSNDSSHTHALTISGGVHENHPSVKLSLPTFGLASYKLKASVWDSDGVDESQKVNSLSQAADSWLRLLQVNHPDYTFFVSREVYRR